MDKFDRIHTLHRLLKQARHPLPAERLMRELECSRATLTRLIEYMRNFLNAPICSSRQRGGYWYDRAAAACELPGVWFNPSELYALLASLQLLQAAQPGLLEAEIRPLTQRIQTLLNRVQLGSGEMAQRMRILRMAARAVDADCFRLIASAVLQRQRLRLRYHSRSDDRSELRLLSPQRLVHYRDNWYLDAWCHERAALRTFALDRITEPEPLAEPALEIDPTELDAHYGAAYGIFAGPGHRLAVLRFSAHQARWVADESWHPQQQGQWLPDGSYELRIPYGQPDELILDILRHGPEVEVIAPAELRAEVGLRLHQAAARYLDLA